MEYKIEQFIRKLLATTLKINFQYHRYPLTDISTFDCYLRTNFHHSELLYEQFRKIFQEIPAHTIYQISDNYLLHYIAFSVPDGSGDVITLGPYTIEPVDTVFYNRIIEINHLSFSQLNGLKDFLYKLPLADNHMQLFSVIEDILILWDRDLKDYSIEQLNLNVTEAAAGEARPFDDFESLIQDIELRYQLQEKIFDAVSNGNQAGALAANRIFLNQMFAPRLVDTLQEKKYMLASVNTICRVTALKKNVHPYYLHELASRHTKKIDRISYAEIESYCEKILISYCHLIKNRSQAGYSALVGNVINHIELNLSQPLSLSKIAAYFHISSPYLSGTFKKETGITITDYINECRIKTAVGLLNTSKLQIQDIAYHIGLEDVNYFTRLFKKVIGCTPSQYRKNFHSK